MSGEKEVTGKFKYEQDSKRYHRFKIETDAGLVGTVYVPKDTDAMPKRLILEYAGRKESWNEKNRRQRNITNA